MSPIRVLMVDDSKEEYVLVREALRAIPDERYRVDWAEDGAAALNQLEVYPYEVCLIDYDLGKQTGVEVLRAAKARGFDLPFIMLSGQGSREIDLEAMQNGVMDYLSKDDLTSPLLERAIRYAIQHHCTLKKLRQRTAELEAQNRELDAYSHTIAHDLTSPLHLISGYAALIAEAHPDEFDEIMNWAHTIRDSAQRMTGMITQLLWLARVRDTDAVLATVDAAPLVNAALLRFTQQIEARGIQIEVAVDLPSVIGQSAWLEEVFANLIGNAIKYLGDHNPCPTIRIVGKRRGDQVIYEVQDNGIGIAPADQQRLFQMFSRVGEQQHKVQGLGLGLSIVRRIVAKLGGSVGVRSEAGQGSTFWFALPAAQEQAA